MPGYRLQRVCSNAFSLDRSGVYCSLQLGETYTDKAYENDVALGARIEYLSNPDEVRKIFPASVNIAVPEHARGYLNRDGGWAFASQGISRMMDKVTALGGKILPGKPVSELLKTDGRTTGVRCEDGSVFDADLVVLSAGSWTASAFPELSMQEQCLATGCVRRRSAPSTLYTSRDQRALNLA